MAKNTQISFIQGQTFVIRFDMIESGSSSPRDITNVGFTGSIKETYSSTTSAASFTIDKISPETSGSFYATIDSGSSAVLNAQDYVYDLFMVSGSVVEPVVEGRVIVRPGVTVI